MQSQETSTAKDADRPLATVILAAGQGTRMNSDLPKVAHLVADRPMVEWVVDAARAVGSDLIVIVVGYGREVVEKFFENDQDDIRFALQAQQLGTAHAVESARAHLAEFRGDVLVLCGDGPLIRAATLAKILNRHRTSGAAATLATAVVDDPTGYGRVVRDRDGSFAAIVEHNNASPEQRGIREINPSYYCFESAALFDALPRIDRNELSGEFYLTDVPALLKQDGKRIEVIEAVPAEDVLSINTPEQLAEVDRILCARLEACS
ncbi:MAG: NTP transferase domain-containing protein [Phycisphaerales bacterium]